MLLATFCGVAVLGGYLLGRSGRSEDKRETLRAPDERNAADRPIGMESERELQRLKAARLADRETIARLEGRIRELEGKESTEFPFLPSGEEESNAMESPKPRPRYPFDGTEEALPNSLPELSAEAAYVSEEYNPEGKRLTGRQLDELRNIVREYESRGDVVKQKIQAEEEKIVEERMMAGEYTAISLEDSDVYVNPNYIPDPTLIQGSGRTVKDGVARFTRISGGEKMEIAVFRDQDSTRCFPNLRSSDTKRSGVSSSRSSRIECAGGRTRSPGFKGAVSTHERRGDPCPSR